MNGGSNMSQNNSQYSITLPTGEVIDVIAEMRTQCFDFGPYEYTITELLESLALGDNEAQKSIDSQVVWFVDSLANGDEDLQSSITFDNLCDMVHEVIDRYYNEVILNDEY